MSKIGWQKTVNLNESKAKIKDSSKAHFFRSLQESEGKRFGREPHQYKATVRFVWSVPHVCVQMAIRLLTIPRTKVYLSGQMESEATRTQVQLQRVAELERVVGQKQLELDFLNKLLEIGSKELGFDVKKI